MTCLLPCFDDFDIALEEVVDQFGELDAFGVGAIHGVGLHRLVEADGEAEQGIGGEF